MNTLEELTNKIYSDGVEKGKAEAASIIEKAQSEAADILAKAQKEAADKIAAAEQKAAELSTNTKAELKLYMEQSLSALKTSITNLLADKIASDSIKAATSDDKFMQAIIAQMATQMVKEGTVKIEAKAADELKKYFAANAKDLLNHGIEIKEVKGLKTDFSIQSAEGGYKLNFGEEEFIAYFKEFLRPELIEILF